MKTVMTALAVVVLGGALWALEDDVQKWVRDLGSDDQGVRESAAQNLEKAGDKARPALDEAAKSDDPEVAYQAKKLLEKFAGGTKPEADPDGQRPKQRAVPHVMRGNSMRIIIGRNGEQTSISEGSDGKVVVQETKDGATKTYEGDSRADFTEKYPELARKYGLDREGSGFSFGPGRRPGAQPDPQAPDEALKEIERMQQEMLRRQEELLKKLQEDGGFRDLDELQKELEKAFRDHPADREPRPARSALGLQVGPVDEALRYQLDLPSGGVLLTEVAEGSRGEKLGLQKFDILVAVNGKTVNSAQEIREAIVSGEELTAEVIREGQRIALKEKE